MQIRLYIGAVAVGFALAWVLYSASSMSGFIAAAGIGPSHGSVTGEVTSFNPFYLLSRENLERMLASNAGLPNMQPIRGLSGITIDPAALNPLAGKTIDVEFGKRAWISSQNARITRDIMGPSIPGRR